MAGLFCKVRNQVTGQRYVISTIRKSQDLFETAVFEANFFYFPRSLKHPVLTVHCDTPEAAQQIHDGLGRRLTMEYPARLFQEYQHYA